MLALSLLATLAFAPEPACPIAAPAFSPVGMASDSLRAIYESGQSFPEFLAAAERRKEMWEANYKAGEPVDATMVARADAVGGTWHILVVAIDSCSDSVSTIPYLARLVEQVEGLEMRIVLPNVGKSVQEAHRTPDGRAATPTVVLLNPNWEVVGCFVERPVALREWLEAHTGESKMDWYADDLGRTTVAQFVDVLEKAGHGEMRCE